MQTAAVIDLEAFRARRAPAARPAAAPVPVVAYAPFWIVWVPAWPIR